MRSTDTLIRKSDRKEFRVTLHSHVSYLEAADGEQDAVKWGWGDGPEGAKEPALYISMTQGHGYHIKAR